MGTRKKATRKASAQTPALTNVRAQVDATREFVAKYQDRVLDLLAQDTGAMKRFYQTFSICIAQEPKLAQCTRASVVGAMLEMAALKLEPGVLGEAWPIPFRDRKRNVMEAQVIVGYKGMMKLARNSGQIGRIDSEVVYEKDPFDWLKGTGQYLNFRKSEDAGGRGKMVAAYALADIQGFKEPQFEVMLAPEILAIKARAPSAKASSSPWTTDEEAMWRKTVLRRLCKFLPTSVEAQRAAMIDELLDAGRTQDLRTRADDLPEIPVIDGSIADPPDEGESDDDGGEADEEQQGEEQPQQ